jgi:hypothetical protein
MRAPRGRTLGRASTRKSRRARWGWQDRFAARQPREQSYRTLSLTRLPEDLVALGEEFAVGLEVSAGRDEDPGALEAVEEHRPVLLSENVPADLDDQGVGRMSRMFPSRRAVGLDWMLRS